MIGLGKIFNDNSAAIGLSALGLSKKVENSSKATQVSAETRKIQQNMTAFSATNSQNTTHETLRLNFTQQKRDAVENLFGRNTMLNFNSGKFTV